MGRGGFGGFGGGMGNMQQLMRQAQKKQQDIARGKEELTETEVTAVSGGGMVEVVMTCDKKVRSVKIKPEAVDPDDVEMLEDLVVAALNEAMKLADAETEKKMGPMGGLGV